MVYPCPKIFEEFDQDITDFENFDKPFYKIKNKVKCSIKQIVENNYKKQIMLKLSNITNESKLFLYKHIKTKFELESYLLKESSFKNRQILTKFRVTDHSLNIEIGRYKNILRENRICTECKEIEDEYHFFLYCNLNKQFRQVLFQKLQLNQNIDINNKLEYIEQILNPNLELVPHVCDFIKQSLALRK